MSDELANDLARRFFDVIIDAHPEEATTLGVDPALGHAGRLGDPSKESAAVELGRMRSFLREARALLAGALSIDARLDLDAVVRVASFHERRIETDADASSLEVAALPNAVLQHAALHSRTDADWRMLATRARETRAFLTAHGENLRRGVREGRAPDADIVNAFVERILPGAAEATMTLPRLAKERGVAAELLDDVAASADSASDAYRSFARLVEDIVVPSASEKSAALGEEEVAFRLRSVMGVGLPGELLAIGRASLERAHEAIMERAGTSTLEAAHGAVQELFTKRPASMEEALRTYDEAVAASTRFTEEHAIVSVPRLALELAPLPPAIADGSGLTNWPAPLLDPEGRGHVLYAPHAPAHPSIMRKNLAVHEAIPGHYLQSVAWQRMLANEARRAPASAVRWLSITDDVAMARGFFGTMVSVEGWAVHMEHVLFEQGFYDEGPESLFAAVCDAIRATRVILDLELHAGEMTTEEAISFVASVTLMPLTWARWQVLRAKRIPLQGLTYLIGAHEIARLRTLHADIPLARFHDALLRYGPVPPSRLKEADFSAT